MLIMEAEICFDKLSENKNALLHDPLTKNILRPAINFGEDLLFSGTILAEKDVTELKRGKNYKVIIEMPTIEREAYEMIRKYLNAGHAFLIQTGARIIGRGKIFDYVYG